ncbi:unnamed protein product [Protopolystoma xenopodis]|uniref:Uncharacterized protein n=1 Tax=Protopolystoma xenopodis TaxID=117903 RepID=A0A3S5BEJ8_9PLAT|nr:unnamed protein product [Protopolystoma xenopodis]
MRSVFVGNHHPQIGAQTQRRRHAQAAQADRSESNSTRGSSLSEANCVAGVETDEQRLEGRESEQATDDDDANIFIRPSMLLSLESTLASSPAYHSISPPIFTFALALALAFVYVYSLLGLFDRSLAPNTGLGKNEQLTVCVVKIRRFSMHPFP